MRPAVTKKHGHTGAGWSSPEYNSWQAMKDRCLNPKNPKFKAYGASGIAVCDRWLNDFPAFLADMGARPKGTSIDRIDGSKGYSPDNCRWATVTQQNRNRPGYARTATINGVTKCLTEWGEMIGIGQSAMNSRFHRGITGEALLKPRQWRNQHTGPAPKTVAT